MFISITEKTVAQADTVSRTSTTEPRVGTGGDDVSSAERAVAEDYRICVPELEAWHVGTK